MKNFIEFNGNTIEYEIKISKGIKNSYIQIDKLGNVVIKTNKKNSSKAKDIITQKAKWILKKLQEISNNKQTHDDENEILFFGEKYTIKLLEGYKNTYKFDGAAFHLYFYNNDAEFINSFILACKDHFYKTASLSYLPEKIDFWSKKMNLDFKDLKVRKMKRRWGSCSSKNEITLNSYITKLPEDLIEYIIIHELAHIKEKNHSKRFWDLVAVFCPDYKIKHKKTLALSTY